MLRNFTVTKQSDAAVQVEGVEQGELDGEQPARSKYATRALFVLLLMTGASLVSLGVGLVVTCRQEVTKQSCGIALHTGPCSDVAVSAYFGCILILATIFGFGCVGRKAMAVLLCPVVIGEVVYGIYILVSPAASVEDAVATHFSHNIVVCSGNVNNNNITTTTTSDLETFQCWQHQTRNFDSCGQFLSSMENCFNNNSAGLPVTATQSGKLNLHVDNCAGEVDRAIDNIVHRKVLILGILLLLHAVLHIVFAVCLWSLRRSSPQKRGLGMVPLPKKFSRARKSVRLGTNEADECDKSLIMHPDTSVINMQKYVFKKLRRQKNTYATV